MMGRQDRDQGQLFYEFKLDDVIPKNHLLRRLNVFVTTALAGLHEELKPFLQRDRPPVGRSRTHDSDADRRVLLRYPTRTPSVRGIQAAPCLPVVL